MCRSESGIKATGPMDALDSQPMFCRALHQIS